jgi:hypothetical protein
MEQAQPDRLVILSKGVGKMFEADFFFAIQDAFLAGYRIADTMLRDDISMRNFQGHRGRAVLYKEGTAPEKWTPKVSATAEAETPDFLKIKEEDQELSSGVAENKPLTKQEEFALLSKPKDLREFAAKHKIDLGDAQKAKEIKAVITEALEA